MKGSDAFVWHARLKAIGIPVAGVAASRRLWRGDGVAAACRSAAVVLAVVWLESELEFLWRRQQRRRTSGHVTTCTVYLGTN